jgi:hypothetical protein
MSIPPKFHVYSSNIPSLFLQNSMSIPLKFHVYSSKIPRLFHQNSNLYDTHSFPSTTKKRQVASCKKAMILHV